MGIGENSGQKRSGFGGRIVGTLFFAVFFAAGVFFEVFIGSMVATHLGTYFWQRSEATIAKSEVIPATSNDRDPQLRVSYVYRFDGTDRTAERVYADAAQPETKDAYRLAARYTPGARVPCWVNPKSPDEAVLERKNPALALLVFFPLIFVAVGGVGIYAMWRQPAAADETPRPISSRARANAGRTAMAFFFGVFLTIGSVVGFFFVLKPLWLIAGARTWVQTPCEIVSSRVRTHSDSDGDTYNVDIVYRYAFDGRSYTSNRFQFFSGSSSGYKSKAAVVRNYRRGKKTVCYVNPRDPADAVLNRRPTPELWFGLIPLVFAAIGAVGLRHTLRRRTAAGGGAFTTGSKPASLFRATSAMPLSHGYTHAAGAGDDEAPRTLAPAASPKIKLIGIAIAAVFWNGIVSVFLFNLFSERWSGFNWFLALFLTPFVLIGLGLVGGVAYQFMALFNPRPRLTVSRAIVHPGETVDVRWELSGRVHALRRLRIYLEGREEATYRAGKNTRTDRATFATIEIAETSDPVAMRSGAAKLHVPPGAMHSFKSANNKIVWSLRVKGEIPRRPDVDEEFLICVAPKPFSS